MKPSHPLPLLLVLAGVAMLAWTGCTPHSHDDGHAHGGESGQGHGHGHDEESPSGASFKEGKGVMLIEATRESIGLQITDVIEKSFPHKIPVTLQIFAERHQHPLQTNDHSLCHLQASGFLDAQRAALVKPGLRVEIFNVNGPSVVARVQGIHKTLAFGESEVVIDIPHGTPTPPPDLFHRATIELPKGEASPTVPASAVLQTAEGKFVYTVNGDAYYRTAIQIAAEADGWVAVSDGLLSGDQVVTHPVQTLWLIELRATKGGGHCH